MSTNTNSTSHSIATPAGSTAGAMGYPAASTDGARPFTTGLRDGESLTQISWKAILAGAFVAVLSYVTLLSLGLAVGGANLQGVIEGGDTARGLGIGTGVWLVVSMVLSVFAGAFAAGLSNRCRLLAVGRMQGIVVASLFFLFTFSQLGAAIGAIGRGVGATAAAVGTAGGALARNEEVQSLVEDTLGTANLKSPPDVIARGVAARLARGNDESAVNYLAAQTGTTREEAERKYAELKTNAEKAATDAGIAAARTMKTVGWTLFAALVLGMLGGYFGGAMGIGRVKHGVERYSGNA